MDAKESTDMVETEQGKPIFQTKVDKLDVTSTLGEVMGQYQRFKWLAVLHSRRFFKDLNPSFYSIANIDLRRMSQETFEPVLGSLIIQGDFPPSNLNNFYNHERYFIREGGNFELRGPNYYVALDKNKIRPEEKIQVMEKDLKDGLEILTQFKREDIKSEKEYLLYLGILDYLKMHSITLFHTLTFSERKGWIPSSDNEKQTYLETRKNAVNLMVSLTKIFYQACLGQPYDDLNINNLEKTVDILITQLKQSPNLKGKRSNYKFPYLETVHPLTIMLGAQETAIHNPEIETVIGIPSGGTEASIAVQLAYQYLQGKKIENIFIAQSIHGYYKGGLPINELTALMEEIYPSSVKNRNILLVDDNSNTGTTLQTMAEAVLVNQAKSVKAHLVLHDPQRIINKYEGGKGDTIFLTNHQNFRTTMGLLSLTKESPTSDKLIELHRFMILKRLEEFYSRKS